MANPVGRPTAYKPEYCSMLVEHMKSGLSFESFAGVVDVGRNTIYEWAKEHQEFQDAKSRASAASLLHWEIKGRDCLHEAKFQASVYIFTMKARFKWADQVVVKDEQEEAERKRIRELPMKQLVDLIKQSLPEEEE